MEFYLKFETLVGQKITVNIHVTLLEQQRRYGTDIQKQTGFALIYWQTSATTQIHSCKFCEDLIAGWSCKESPKVSSMPFIFPAIPFIFTELKFHMWPHRLSNSKPWISDFFKLCISKCTLVTSEAWWSGLKLSLRLIFFLVLP